MSRTESEREAASQLIDQEPEIIEISTSQKILRDRSKLSRKPLAEKKKSKSDASQKSTSATLDTEKVARTFKSVLIAEKINQSLVAHEVIKICPTVVNKLINHPIKWSECSGKNKKLYKRMNDWCKCNEDVKRLAAMQRKISK